MNKKAIVTYSVMFFIAAGLAVTTVITVEAYLVKRFSKKVTVKVLTTGKMVTASFHEDSRPVAGDTVTIREVGPAQSGDWEVLYTREKLEGDAVYKYRIRSVEGDVDEWLNIPVMHHVAVVQ